MISLITPPQAQALLTQKARERRVQLGLTQEGLAIRAGVSLATLRKFEQSGQISLATFLKLALVLEALTDLTAIFNHRAENFTSLDEVLKADKPKRKKGWRK